MTQVRPDAGRPHPPSVQQQFRRTAATVNQYGPYFRQRLDHLTMERLSSTCSTELLPQPESVAAMMIARKQTGERIEGLIGHQGRRLQSMRSCDLA